MPFTNPYKVKSGDTLGKISKNNNIDVNVLAKMNKIKDVNKINVGDTLNLKNSSIKPIKQIGFSKMNVNTNLSNLSLAKTDETINPVEKPIENKKNDISGKLSKGLAIGGATMDLFTDDSPELDMSGNTDYSNVKSSDVGAGITDTLEDTLNFASKGMAVGGPIGAAVGGVLGLGKSLINGDKQKKKLRQAKERFQNKQRYQSEQAIDEIANQDKMKEIVGDDNMNYIENLRNSPGYNRFKRNSQYTI